MIAEVTEKMDEVRELCRRFRVARLELFGSAAAGDYEPGRSDLDFLVTFEEMTPVEHKNCYFGLLWALEDLFGGAVDLLERPAVRNKYLWQSIDPTRELLYAA